MLGFAVVPVALSQLLIQPSQDRHIHVESFRYGKEPSVIRCHRGDRLHLTFSSRDTGHSFFLEEFDVDVKISPVTADVFQFRATEPQAPPVRTREVVVTAEHPGPLGWLFSKSAFRCHVWCGPMHAFEHGNLIIQPNTLLYAGLGMLLGIPLLGWLRVRRGSYDIARGLAPEAPTDGRDLFKSMPWLKRLVKQRGFQFVFVLLAMAAFYVIVLTTLFGTQMSGRNLGSMLMWIVWLFVLAAVLTPFGGRLWCLACPLPALGEGLQRRALTGVRTGSSGPYNNQLYGQNRRWPKMLANAWPRTLIFLTMGTFSTLLVASPRVSGLVVLGMLLVATAMSLIWELRAFCRYLCPINAFIGLYSMAGKLAVRTADPTVCAACNVRTCLKGDAKGWACPYGLCIAEVNENNDCGMCTECIKSCAYDNVTLRWRPLAHERTVRTTSEAFQSMAMLSLAGTYCIVHLGHWPAIRDSVNILDKGNWSEFGIFALVLWAVALVVVPTIMLLAAAAGKVLAASPKETFQLMVRSTGALVPLGLFLWIAFVVPMLFVNVSFVAQSVSDPFGWGWDFFGTAGTPWRQLWPRGVPWIQVACVLAGLSYSLRNGWRIWVEQTECPRQALRGVVPLAVLLVAFSGWFVFFFAD